VTCPTTKVLENEFYPDVRRIGNQAAAMIEPERPAPIGPQQEAPEIKRFKGPF
jgi:hypothetical protein